MPATSSRKYITDFGPTERFDGVFTLANAQLGTTRAGKPYLRCLLSDKSGQLPARMWSISEELFRKLPTDGFVFAEGDTQPFQGELQLIVQNIQPITPSAKQLTELLPTTSRDIDEMFKEVVSLLDSLEHPAMLALAKTYLDDERLMEEFRTTPAAKMLHHAYLGHVDQSRSPGDEPEALVVYTLSAQHWEGMASLVDKPRYLDADLRRQFSSDQQETANVFVQHYLETPAMIHTIDSVLSGINDGTLDANESGRWLRQAIPWGGHPNGLFMAQTIERAYGRDELVSLTDPFAFFLRYDDAAHELDAPAFSEETREYVSRLRESYVE